MGVDCVSYGSMLSFYHFDLPRRSRAHPGYEIASRVPVSPS